MARFLVGKYDNAIKPSWIVKAVDDRDAYHIFASSCYPWSYSRQNIVDTAEKFGLSENDLEFYPSNVQ